MASLSQNENKYFAAATDISGTAPNAGVVTADDKLEGTAHVMGDAGTFILAVRKDAPAILVANGQYSEIIVDQEGKIITAPYGSGSGYWQSSVVLSDTSPVVIKASAGTGNRNCLTDLNVSNSSLVATLLDVLDGATPIYTVLISAGVTVHLDFTLPVRGTAATALSVASRTAVSSLYVNAQGYRMI